MFEGPQITRKDPKGPPIGGVVHETGHHLLRRLRGGDRAALGEIAEEHGAALSRTAFLILGDAQAGADAAQDALIAAWDSARRTGEGTNLRPWLMGILYRICRKRIRTASRRRRRERLFASRRPEAYDVQQETVNEVDSLRHALLRLNDALRVTILLRFEEGLTIAQTAQALGIPDGTVKSRTHEAILKLRGILGEIE